MTSNSAAALAEALEKALKDALARTSHEKDVLLWQLTWRARRQVVYKLIHFCKHGGFTILQ